MDSGKDDVSNEAVSAKSKGKKAGSVIVNVFECKYAVVRDQAKALGWRISNSEDSKNFTIRWVDLSIGSEKVVPLKNYQMINHFAGMQKISHKAGLARTLNAMKLRFPKSYIFHPYSYVLPQEMGKFRDNFDAKGKSKKTFILKPSIVRKLVQLAVNRSETCLLHFEMETGKANHDIFASDGFAITCKCIQFVRRARKERGLCLPVISMKLT